MEKEFENYWKHHQRNLIERAPQSLNEERKNSGKMNTAGDWLLFALPVIAMSGFISLRLFSQELVNFLVSLAVGAAFFVLTMFIKPYVTGKRNIVDIDEDIKQHFYRIYQEKGLKGLETL
ncbi:MAG: hypothetical protein I3J02_06885 [Prevotella sp.]|nr:hypothetical protein [Prevotella sp.]